MRLRRGGWYELDLAHQPTRAVEPVQVAIEVPEGWEIVKAPGLTRRSDRQAGTVFEFDRNRTIRVKIAPQPASSDLWARLQAGT